MWMLPSLPVIASLCVPANFCHSPSSLFVFITFLLYFGVLTKSIFDHEGL